jgi:IS30 family transposase
MQAGQENQRIADILGVHQSTIGREIKRNRGGKGYRPKQAQQKAQARRHGRRTQIGAQIWKYVEGKLQEKWSPEQVSGCMKINQGIKISHEWIYQHILADKQAGGSLHQHLRCQKKKRKRYGVYDRRGSLPNRMSIENRPKVVEERSRIGDWEGDTIIGKWQKQAIVTLVDRRSRLLLMQKVDQRTAHEVSLATVSLLSAWHCETLTSDNGKEFAFHERIAKELNLEYYFAHPFSAWERGTNENTNGLIRQYFPKHKEFNTIKDEDIKKVMDELNNRPRKCLGFRTPIEVFSNHSVALAS